VRLQPSRYPCCSWIIVTQTDEDFNQHNVYAVNVYAVFLCAFSGGYFLYDLIEEAAAQRPPFMVHGLLSFLVYTAAFYPRPFCLWHAVLFLLFEASTPFYNYRCDACTCL